MNIINQNKIEEMQLGDMYVEKDGYVLTHQEFSTLKDLKDFLKSSSPVEDGEPDIIQVLTVENNNDDDSSSYVVSFEVVLGDDTNYLISLYFGAQTGLIPYDSYDGELDDFESMEQIEENCAAVLKSFIISQEIISKNDTEEDIDDNTENDTKEKVYKKIELICPYCGSCLNFAESYYSDFTDDGILLEDIICDLCKKTFEINYIPTTIYETGDIETEEEEHEDESEDYDDGLREEDEHEEKIINTVIVNFSHGSNKYTLEYEEGILNKTPEEIAKNYFNTDREIAQVQVDDGIYSTLLLREYEDEYTFDVVTLNDDGQAIDFGTCDFDIFKNEKELIYALTKIE